MIKSHLLVLLAEKRWTRSDLARKTGIRINTICDICNDMADRVNLEHIDRICEVLNCNVSDIFVYVKNDIPKTGNNLIKEAHGNRIPDKV